MFLTLIYVFITKQDVNIENFGIHGLPRNISEMSAMANVEKPKIGISKTQLLIVTYLCYIPLNICFEGWEISINYLREAYFPIKVSKTKMAAKI